MIRSSFILLFISLILASCKPAVQEPNNPIDFTENRNLKSLPAETIRQLVKERKVQSRELPVFTSPFENMTEIGPNINGLACLTDMNNLCISGMVKELVVDSEDNNMFVIATESSGAWVSYNKGENWQPIDENWIGVNLRWVTQSSNDPNLYYFCGEGPGLLLWDKGSNEGLVEWVGEIDGVPASTFDFVSYIKNDPMDPTKHYLAGLVGVYHFDGEGYTKLYRYGIHPWSWISIPFFW